MFDLAWSEIFLILAVAVLVIPPADWPAIARRGMQLFAKIKDAGQELFDALREAEKESGITEAKSELTRYTHSVRRIVDLEGNVREAFDVETVEKELELPLKNKKKA